MTAPATVDDLQGAKLRKVFRELMELEPDAAHVLADHPLIVAAFDQLGRRLFQCPQCFVSVELPHHKRPQGWLIVEPFTRVAACGTCRSKLPKR